MSFDVAFREAPKGTKNAEMVAQGDDRNTHAEFHYVDVYMPHKSESAGRAIYERVAYLRLTFPGNRFYMPDTIAKMKDDEQGPSDPNRFPKQWAAFLASEEQVPDGTPLTTYPPLTSARIKELKSVGIHTVEQLATLPEQNAANIGLGWRVEQQTAQKWLEQAANGSAVTKLVAENDRLKADVEMLKNQIGALAQGKPVELSQESDYPRARRGRPASINKTQQGAA